MNKYIVKSAGTWNEPSIESDIVGLSVCGYEPMFSGGCIGIIPHTGNPPMLYALLSEDDGYYFDNGNLTKIELATLRDIVQQLANDVDIKIGYVNCTSEIKYHPDKETFFNKQYSKDDFNVVVKERVEYSPLVTITHKESRLNLCTDISWCKLMVNVMNDALNAE